MQYATIGVVREGYWYLVGLGIKRYESSGYAYPEWDVQVLSNSTDANCYTITGETCEFLGYKCRVLHHPRGADIDHTL